MREKYGVLAVRRQLFNFVKAHIHAVTIKWAAGYVHLSGCDTAVSGHALALGVDGSQVQKGRKCFSPRS